MSEIVFGQSYYLRFDPKLWQAMQPYPPLGTMYAASYMRTQGYTVALFDAMLAESEQEWDRILAHEQPRYAVIYEDNFNYLSKMCLLRMREAAHSMIAMAKKRGCTVVVCGSDATDQSDGYLAAGADFVLLGEGEATLAELLARLDGKTDTPFDQILGLIWIDQTTAATAIPTMRRNPRRPDIKDVDSLPFPAWDLIDVDRYRSVWLQHHGYYSMNMVTTRGCPFHCNWCAKPIWGQRYNSRSPQHVVAELKWLKETFKPDHIWFADDIVGLKPGWIKRFGELVEAEGAQVPFKCLSRADLLCREGEVAGFRKAGCNIVWMGAESGSQAVLNAMDKGTKVEQIYQAARDLHAAGVQVGFFLQFGYPGETREDIERTLQMVRDCEPDDIGMSVSYPLPGTKFHERVKAEFGTKQNWQDSNDLAMLYNGPYATEFYRQLHVTLHREFRTRRALRTLQGKVARKRSPFRLVATIVKNAVLLPFERLKLKRLEQVPHVGLAAIGGVLSAEAAATPTPQGD
jgi:anaerobic magnesium-protoporphyrin IX monomethyl ester cyclase